MKIIAIVAAGCVLAACAAESGRPAVYTGPLSPEAEAERQQHNAAAQAFMDLQRRMSGGLNGLPPDPATIAAERAMQARNQQAAIICQARGQMAGSQPAFGGFGVTGGIAAGMQLAWASANAEAACINAYRQTGIMPAL